MRKVLILFTCLFFLNGYSQSRSISKIPKKVVEAFERDFPNFIQYKWSKCLHNEYNPIERDYYEVTFLFQSNKCIAKYDFEGNKIETIKFLSLHFLKNDLISFITSNYSDFNIVSIKEIATNELLKRYEIEISNSKDNFKVLHFDDKLNFVSEIPIG